MIRALSVWWDGACVGALQIDEHGDLAFTYAAIGRLDAETTLAIGRASRQHFYNLTATTVRVLAGGQTWLLRGPR